MKPLFLIMLFMVSMCIFKIKAQNADSVTTIIDNYKLLGLPDSASVNKTYKLDSINDDSKTKSNNQQLPKKINDANSSGLKKNENE